MGEPAQWHWHRVTRVHTLEFDFASMLNQQRLNQISVITMNSSLFKLFEIDKVSNEIRRLQMCTPEYKYTSENHSSCSMYTPDVSVGFN